VVIAWGLALTFSIPCSARLAAALNPEIPPPITSARFVIGAERKGSGWDPSKRLAAASTSLLAFSVAFSGVSL